MAKNIINQWNPDFLHTSLLFTDLITLLNNPIWPDWPGCQGMLKLLPEPIQLSSGQPLQMRPQDESLPFPEMGYEERIYKKGIISTREQNWHDLFNAFIWMLFPKTKILLNQLHMQELKRQPGKKRTPARDAITHLDESGVIIAYSNKQLKSALKQHQWQTLFVQSRELWWQQIGAYIFGHGLYEKAFKPFIGFTGKAYCLQVDTYFFQQDKQQQYRLLDQYLSEDISARNSLADASHLSPLPVLGVPGWWQENTQAEFYNNQDYFRPKKHS